LKLVTISLICLVDPFVVTWSLTEDSKLKFLPARRYVSAGNSNRNVSVCLSVTSRYCVKTKKASIMISPPSGVPRRQPYHRSGLANLPSVGAVP